MSNLLELFKKIETTSAKSNPKIEWIIAGLGNPGREYEQTRHNIGFVALDAFAKKLGVPVIESKYHALIGRATVAGQGVLLIKPMTLMNASGIAIREAAAFYKIAPDHILVLHDDISLPVGKLRIRRNGSAGGHNGLKSIIQELSSDAFPRIKLGVGQKPFPDYDLAAWVLGKFPKEELSALEKTVEAALDAIPLILDGKIETAMNRLN